MNLWERFFQRARAEELAKARSPVQSRPNQNAEMQGGYTDHVMSPLDVRRQTDPMPPDEREAFDYCLRKLDQKYPDLLDMRDILNQGLDDGFFLIRKGALYVNPEAPA